MEVEKSSGGGVWGARSEMAPHKGKQKKEEQVISLGPQVAEGGNVFVACHIFDTSVTPFWQETVCLVTGRMKAKADRDESSRYAAMLASPDVV